MHSKRLAWSLFGVLGLSLRIVLGAQPQGQTQNWTYVVLQHAEPSAPQLLTAFPPKERAPVDGRVRLKLRINRTGDVVGIQVLEGDPVLVRIAQDTVRQWKYAPLVDKSGPKQRIATLILMFRNEPAIPAQIEAAGEVRERQFTNKFFRFSYTLPEGLSGSIGAEAREVAGGRLFAGRENPVLLAGELEKERLVFSVEAFESAVPPQDHLEVFTRTAEASVGRRRGKPKKLRIGEKDFWKADFDLVAKDGTSALYTVLATDARGFVLYWTFFAQDEEVLRLAVRSVESIRFESAPEVNSKGTVQAGQLIHPIESAGALRGNEYTNSLLGFSYQFPKGLAAGIGPTARQWTHLGGHELGQGQIRLLAAARPADKARTPAYIFVDTLVGEASYPVTALEVFQKLRMSLDGYGFRDNVPSRQVMYGGKMFWQAQGTLVLKTELGSEKLWVAMLVTESQGYLLWCWFTAGTEEEFKSLLKTAKSIRFVKEKRKK
jgi:hypothetical protein